jgi:hypothetical protein
VVTGVLVDGGGKPVAGAVVSDGVGSTLSDDQGRYVLGVRAEALTASKPLLGRLSWVPERGEQPPRTLSGRGWPPVGALAPHLLDADFSGMAAIAARSTRLVSWPGTPLGELDVLVLVTPRGWSNADVRAVLGWVRRGGRLILCGEWGGYAGQDLEAVRGLAAPAGIELTGGTVRTAAEDAFSVEVHQPAWRGLAVALGGEPVRLFGAAELALSGEARPLLVAARGYVVLATGGTRVLAAVGPLGYGKIVVLGDSSLWRDEDSTGVGRANIALGGNGRLLEALLVW